jgi:hypothetical protein
VNFTQLYGENVEKRLLENLLLAIVGSEVGMRKVV